MIKNDRQLHHARSRLDELKASIAELKREYSGLLRELHTTPLQNSVNKIETQIAEYEELTASSLADAVDGLLKKPHLFEETAELLTKLRIAAGLTQTEMAERLGWQQSNLSRFESDNYSGQTLSKIAEYADALEVWLYIVPELDEMPSRIKYNKVIEFDPSLAKYNFENVDVPESHFWASIATTSAYQPTIIDKPAKQEIIDEYDLVTV
ncbi:MAG: helix-turn-helix transcriptional regulator [Anaerolineales bacterium]|nr:helix-turn-helix transcriptional regulator [Anaerolineales bacterium]